MGRKKILERRKARLEAKIAGLKQRALASQDANEVREINDQLTEIAADLQDIVDEIQAIVDEGDGDGSGDTDGAGADPDAEGRSAIPANAVLRNGDVLRAYGMNTQVPGAQQRNDGEGYASMEYRMAFKDFVQRGTPIPADVIARAGGDKGTTVTADIGAIIPETIMNEFIKEVSKVYGHIYNKVRKMNVRGGVKFPISKLKASFKWITESTVSDKQKAGDIKDFVTFEYNIGEIRVAETLLAQVVSLPMFESEITRIMVEAYLEAMDKGIISGTGSGQLLGITADPRVNNVVEMTEEEFSDWTAWRKNLFAKIPLSKRGQGEFLFPASTVETYLLTMKDANNQPIFREPNTPDASAGALAGKFFGRNVDFVEPDVIKDFATASEGDVVGVYWVPKDYAINTNMQFGMKRYFDDDTNEWVNKGLTIVDGKILDPSGCYLIKKKNAAARKVTK